MTVRTSCCGLRSLRGCGGGCRGCPVRRSRVYQLHRSEESKWRSARGRTADRPHTTPSHLLHSSPSSPTRYTAQSSPSRVGPTCPSARSRSRCSWPSRFEGRLRARCLRREGAGEGRSGGRLCLVGRPVRRERAEDRKGGEVDQAKGIRRGRKGPSAPRRPLARG